MFQILVDSGANLPAELAKKHRIEVLSFINHVDGKNVTCYLPDQTPEEERARGKEFYDSMRNGLTVQTGLIS
ncbi:MAG: DegV family protein, partial [Lachnospiraceae bacterium]|nr:DegV family protein [Lachnospiraceae bacterium]